jgi:hypothetical protein
MGMHDRARPAFGTLTPVILLFLQLPGTFLPLVLLVHETWVKFPVPTFEGQYIIKNIALIAAGIVVGSTVRGGRIIANPEIAEKAVRVERAVEEKLSTIAGRLAPWTVGGGSQPAGV